MIQTMKEVHQTYMDGYLFHPESYSLSQYKVLELIDQVLNQTVGHVSVGKVYKKMSQRFSEENLYE